MPIINPQSLYRLSYIHGSLKKETIHFTYQNSIVRDKFCYYISVADTDSISYICESIPNHILSKIKSGNFYLMIGCEYESFVDLIDLIYSEFVIKENIDPEKIIYITGTLDIGDSVEVARKKYNSEKSISVYFFSTPERYMNSVQRRTEYNLNKPKFKKYLSFNRRWRPHRPFLIGLLQAKNLLKYGYVSLGKADDNLNWQHVYPGLIDIHSMYPCNDTLNLLQERKTEICDLPNLYLDTEDLVTGQARFSDNTIQYYENSYFSVITETNYFSDIRFFTEKTFKAIMMRHPFILVASPYSLDLLKDFGYKSFHPYINEDYDKEKNHCVRMKMIVNEIERLCNLPENELLELMNKLDTTVEYNYQVLKNKIQTIDFIRKLT